MDQCNILSGTAIGIWSIWRMAQQVIRAEGTSVVFGGRGRHAKMTVDTNDWQLLRVCIIYCGRRRRGWLVMSSASRGAVFRKRGNRCFSRLWRRGEPRSCSK